MAADFVTLHQPLNPFDLDRFMFAGFAAANRKRLCCKLQQRRMLFTIAADLFQQAGRTAQNLAVDDNQRTVASSAALPDDIGQSGVITTEDIAGENNRVGVADSEVLLQYRNSDSP